MRYISYVFYGSLTIALVIIAIANRAMTELNLLPEELVFFDFNSSYPNYYNLFHLIPKILISLLSIFGAIFALGKKGFFQFISIFYIINICLFSIFFILPRYSLILLPIKLLLSIFVLKKLARK